PRRAGTTVRRVGQLTGELVGFSLRLLLWNTSGERTFMLISVIIPTLNEEVNLPVTLRQLAEHPDVELIVVDGGSTDRTVEIAQRFTPFVFVTVPGRASQMNVGARH